MLKQIYRLIPGFIITCLIAVIAFFLHTLPIWPLTLPSGHHPFESMTIAIILGIITNGYFLRAQHFALGVKFCAKYALYAAIICLGAKLNLTTLLHLSWQIISIIITCILASYCISLFIGKIFKITAHNNILIAFGTAICGSSAIAAISPTIKASKQDTVIAIAAINLFGTLAIFLFPMLGHYLNLSPAHFAIWAGTSIQAVPQVVAASFTYSHAAGSLGTTVKLVRVLFLAPALFIILKLKTNQINQTTQQSLLPWYKAVPPFIILFFLVILLFSIQPNTSSPLESIYFTSKQYISSTSNLLMVIAMAAIGMQVSFKDISTSGLTPILVAGLAFSALTLISLGLILSFL